MGTRKEGKTMSTPEISVQELDALRQAGADVFILDVRNPDEFAICNLSGHLIPFAELPTRLNELNPKQHIVIHCHAGGRSRRATEYLLSQGFKNVQNLRGGITAWANEIDPKMRKY
jgi:rhodanese-related sulfurtransferase